MIGHGFTPGRFSPDTCRVQLARYSCPWPREQHDPSLQPEDLDAFGRRRTTSQLPTAPREDTRP